MNNRSQLWNVMLAGLLVIAVADVASGQAAGQPVIRNIEEMKFAPVPGLPTCAPGAVQSGDPGNAPKCTMAMIGFLVPKTDLNFVVTPTALRFGNQTNEPSQRSASSARILRVSR